MEKNDCVFCSLIIESMLRNLPGEEAAKLEINNSICTGRTQMFSQLKTEILHEANKILDKFLKREKIDTKGIDAATYIHDNWDLTKKLGSDVFDEITKQVTGILEQFGHTQKG